MQRRKLRAARNRLSEVVKHTLDEGPQTVTARGKPAAVVLSATACDPLTEPKPPLTGFFLSGPSWPDDLVDTINDRSQ